MASSHKSEIDIMCKLGVFITILPYYSMNKDAWDDLMWQLNRKSRRAWNDNYNLLKNLHTSIECDQLEQMQRLIRMYVDPAEKLDDKLTLYLN